jgi:hypothetical protein
MDWHAASKSTAAAVAVLLNIGVSSSAVCAQHPAARPAIMPSRPLAWIDWRALSCAALRLAPSRAAAAASR